MANDTISRQAAIDALNGEFTITGRKNAETIRNYINGVDKRLRELPSAERRGRWEDVEHAPNGLLYATCSVCGKRQTIEATNYCGNCGARMRETKNGCDDCFIPMFYNLEDDDSICRDCEAGE